MTSPWGESLPRGLVVLVFLSFVVGLAACQRPRPTASGSGDGRVLTVPAIVVAAPAAGAVVASPLTVAGTASLDSATQTLVGMVFSVDETGEHWRGNASIAVQPDGRFAGNIVYTAATAGPGIVQLAVIDGAAGTVMARQRVDVQLAAAPAP